MLTSCKTALVCGAGGFIGHHLVRRLKQEGLCVRGVDLKYPRFSDTAADEFVIGDLRDQIFVRDVLDQRFDEIYQLAADMGGAGYIFTGDHDAEVMHNSSSINLNVLHNAHKHKTKRIFYSSSACIYPEHNQRDPNNPTCAEASAYPAAPDSEYGWEKLFSERLYLAYARNFDMEVRIARYHNIFGPEGSWNDGKEKAPAAICRKVAMARDGGEIEIWGDGKQTRSFLYIDTCLEGTLQLMRSDFTGPFNIGSDEMVSVDQLVDIVAGIAGKSLKKCHVDGPTGVRGRKSDNRLICEKLGWAPSTGLVDGLKPTYNWIRAQVTRSPVANEGSVEEAAITRAMSGSRTRSEPVQVT
jgi:GDP-D-mannose 3', 5'-epimerase